MEAEIRKGRKKKRGGRRKGGVQEGKLETKGRN